MKTIIHLLFVLGILSTAQAQIDRSQIPEAGPMPNIQLKNPERFELKNGLKILLVENHKLPRVSIQLSIDQAPIQEGEKAGTSSLLGSMLGKGSATISKDDFYEEVDFLGASIRFGALNASANSLSKVYPRILEMLADAALHPVFSQVEFDKEKDKLITSIESNDKSVNDIAARLQRGVAYGIDHPLGEFESKETVSTIGVEDIKSFYQNYFSPNNAYLVIIGDIDINEAKKLVKKNFSSWKKSSNQNTYKPKEITATGTSISFVDMPNAKQSVVTVQNLVDLKMSNEDYLDALLANNILGGTATARLFMNLREDKAYTYGSYSSLGNSKYDKARFRAYASVRNSVTDSAAVQILSEINRIQNEKVTDQELADAKAIYIGSFVMGMEKPETIARYALNIETQNLPKDFYETYLSRLESVTAADVQAAAQKYLSADQAQVVIAGRGQDVLQNLEKITVNGKPISINYYDKNITSVAKPEYDIAIPDGVSAKTVIEDYISSIGGKAALENIRAISYKASAEVQGMTLEFSVLKTAKNQLKQSLTMMGNIMSEQVFDGEKGFMTLRGQKMPIPEEQLDKVLQEAQLFTELNLDLDQIKIEGVERLGDQKAYKIKLNEDTYGFYDMESHLKIMESTSTEVQGEIQINEVKYGNYQQQEGVLFPFSFSQTMGPQEVEFKVEDLKINPQLSDTAFK